VVDVEVVVAAPAIEANDPAEALAEQRPSLERVGPANASPARSMIVTTAA
jgi:hypothetical protein